jgi:hypothetical protein
MIKLLITATLFVVAGGAGIAAAPPRLTKQSVVPVRFDPCSDWRDVGALLVDPDGATGVRNVRALCAHPGDER